tara:strand:+ start:599 stop:1747 length:1149 start_codon:yes stop_codon:yes gene_type:complete
MPFYLDYHAHSPIDPRVLEKLIAAYHNFDANPHSSHGHGSAAYNALERGRTQVADLIAARPSEIVFTSGATEANNLAFFGVVEHLKSRGKSRIAISSIEHASISAAAQKLQSLGFEIDVLPVNKDGLIDLDSLEAVVTDATGLVSIAAANHEIGVVQPLAEISSILRRKDVLFHSDLAQMAGKLPAFASQLDLASLSAHKLSGPSGIGALYVRRLLKPKLRASIVGGGQESGLRSGSVAVPLCVAFGYACSIALAEMPDEAVRVARYRDHLLRSLGDIIGMEVNGTLEHRLPGNLNLRFEHVDGEALVFHIQDQLSISTGSACSAKTLEPSHVLLAIGLSRGQAECSVRIGIGRFTTEDEIENAATSIRCAVEELRSIRSRA